MSITSKNQYETNDLDDFDQKVLESFKKHLAVYVFKNEDGVVRNVSVAFAGVVVEAEIYD
jgi:hypothetical protein